MSVCLYDCPVATLENSLYGYVLRIHNIVLLFEIVLSRMIRVGFILVFVYKSEDKPYRKRKCHCT